MALDEDDVPIHPPDVAATPRERPLIRADRPGKGVAFAHSGSYSPVPDAMPRVIALPVQWLATFRAWLSPRRWGVLVAAAALVTNLLAFSGMADLKPMSDGIYEWMFARSLAYDHDIDFTNDYRICGDKFHHDKDRGGGHPDNPFYIGPSLFLVPAIEVARLFDHLPADADEQTRLACKGPIMRDGLRAGAFVGGLFVWLAYCAARRFADDFGAAIAAGLFAFGTTLSVYATYASAYSHVYDGACVAGLLVASFRAYEEPRRLGRWVLSGALVAACFLHRATNAPLGLVPVCLAILALRREPRLLALAVGAVGVSSLLLGLVPQLLIYKYFYGHVLGVVPQGQYFMQPAHSHMWLVLFAPKGLFLMAPVAWFAVVGAVQGLRSRAERPVVAILAGAFLVELYLAAMPLDWDASSTIGARRLIALYPILTVLAAVSVARLIAWVGRDPERVRGLVLGLLLVPLGAVFVGEGMYYAEPEHYYDFYPSQEVMYGTGFAAMWRTIDRRLGALALLPAELVFTLRYGLPHEAYWNATHLAWFMRDHQTMALMRPRIELRDKTPWLGTSGLLREKEDAKLEGRRGTVVFCTGWPHATSVTVVARSSTGTAMSFKLRTFFGTVLAAGSMRPGEADQTASFAIRRDAFDSGILEAVFEADDPGADVRIVSIELADKTSYAPVR